MSLETTGKTYVGVPNVSTEGEDGVAVGRRIVVGQDDAHFVQVAENGLARGCGAFNTDDGFDTIPDFVLRRKPHGVLFPDDIGNGRLARVGSSCLAFGAQGVEFLPFFP